MATKSQEILLKGNTTSASAVPSSLKVREIAINALDRSLFTNDGNSIVKLYTGTTKWFDVNGNANNALKLGGVLASEYIGKEAFNTHTNNTTIHITAAERTKWNNKWDYNEETIKGVKVNAAVLSDSATKLATARKIWGQPFDGLADVSGDLYLSGYKLVWLGNENYSIYMQSDGQAYYKAYDGHRFFTYGSVERLKITSGGNILIGTTTDNGYKLDVNGKGHYSDDLICGGEVVAVAGEGTPAGVTDYSALTGKPSINGVTLVSGNNTLAALGIQAAGDYATNSGVTTLLADYAKKTFVANNYASKSAFNSHTADTNIHITASERTDWNAKWNYDEATIKAVKVTSASSADSADTLTSNAGTSAIPIYFDGGIPVQCTPSSLFSTFTNGYDASAGGWRLLMITIAGHTRSVVVAYSETAGSVAWTGITDKPTTFTPSAHTHTASEVSGLPTSLKNPYALTFGSKTYDGSAAATITASDLGALTAHQSIYALTLQVNGTSQGVYNPTSAAKTINIAVPTKTSDITNNSGFITSASIPTALKNPYAVEIKANGVSLGTYDGSKAATFNLSAANVGAANKVHTHNASDISGLPTKLSAFTNDVGYITGITKSMVEGVLTGDITSHTHSYLPLSGGTLTGPIIIKKAMTNEHWGAMTIKYNGSWSAHKNYIAGINVEDSSGIVGRFGVTFDGSYGKFIVRGLYNSAYDKSGEVFSVNAVGDVTATKFIGSLSGNAATATNADKLDGQEGEWYQKNVIAFKYNSGSSLDANAIRDGIIWNYGSVNYWLNAPSKMSYGQILNLRSGQSYALAGQLAWDVNHNSTTDTTGNLWWRASDQGDWVEAQWHQIAFTDSNIASATKLQDNTAFTAWGQTFFENGKPKNVSGDLSMERSKIYWNGDINGSYISSHGMTEMIYEMRDGHSFYVNGDMILRIKRYNTYKLQVYGKTNITGDLVVDGEVSALVA